MDHVLGGLYRVRAVVPPEHIRRMRAAHGENGQKALLHDVEERIQASGFRPSIAILQDPTDNRVFTAIAYLTDPAAIGRHVSIASVEPVEAPPQSQSDSAASRRLDAGLTADEVSLVRRTLAVDENARHVGGVASTFEPFFPIAASLLRAKEILLEARAPRRRQALAGLNRQILGRSGTLRNVPPVADSIATASQEAIGESWPEVDAMWRRLGTLEGPWAFRTDIRSSLDDANPPPARTPADDVALAGQLGVPPDVLRDEIRRVIVLTARGYDDIAARYPAPIARIASQAVRDLGWGMRVVLPRDLYRLLPPDGREGFVSPTALQLALAEMKPEVARISTPQQAVARLAQLEAAHGGQGPANASFLRARAQMERARRALERRRWVEWARRAEELRRAG